MFSMTGYGKGEYRENGVELTVEVKSVNNRYLDLAVKCPRKRIFRIREIQGAAVFFHDFPNAGQAQPMGGRIFLIGFQNAFLFQNGISFGVCDLISKIAVLGHPRFYRDVTVMGVRDFYGCFDGVIQGVGEETAETDGIDAGQFLQVNMEKAVDPVFHGQIVFGIQDGVDDAVFAESTVSRGHPRLQILQILVGLFETAGVKQGAEHREMVVHIMAQPADLRLILFQLLIIDFLEHQIFPFHISLDTDGKILRQEQAAQIGGKAGERCGPDPAAFLRGKTDTGGDAYHGCQADGVQQDPGSVIEEFFHLEKAFFKYPEDSIPEEQVQACIRKRAENIHKICAPRPDPQVSKQVHDEEILADHQRVEDGDRGQLLPDVPAKGQQHHGQEPDEIQHDIEEIIGKDDHAGDCGAGKIDGNAPEFSVPSFCHTAENSEEQIPLCEIQDAAKSIGCFVNCN